MTRLSVELLAKKKPSGIGSIILHELNDASSGMGMSDHKTFKFIPELMSAMGFKI
jgi:hypothetical protein